MGKIFVSVKEGDCVFKKLIELRDKRRERKWNFYECKKPEKAFYKCFKSQWNDGDGVATIEQLDGLINAEILGKFEKYTLKTRKLAEKRETK